MFRNLLQGPRVVSVNLFVFSSCALLLPGVFTLPARAQSVSFAGLQTTVAISGLQAPSGVAVDGAGNVYVADDNSGFVLEEPAAGGAEIDLAYVGSPVGVTVDKAGDVFFTALYGGSSNIGEVVEIPSGCGSSSCWISFGSGLYKPFGVAVDAAGDVFIADTYNGRVVEVVVGGAQTTVASGLNYPEAVAVDKAGNVYIADTLASSVLKIPAGGGTAAAVGSGWYMPTGVAVDAAGDVFVADSGTGDVVEVPAGGGAQVTLATGLSSPLGVGVDKLGNLFIADGVAAQVLELQRISVNFGYINVGSNSTLTLTYDINDTVTLATNPTVVTQGAPNLDFTLSGTPTCTGAQAAPTTCTATVQFAPRAPGLRQGAVQLKDSTGNLLVTTLLRGVGSGPAVAFPGGPSATVLTSAGYPYDVAADAAGDLFVAENSANRVVKIPAGCSSSVCYATIDSQSYPRGVAVDGAGDVFASHYENGSLVETPAGCTSSACQVNVGSGNSDPTGVALDGAGDIFVAQLVSGDSVLEFPVLGPSVPVGSGLSDTGGVAVDGNGNVFIAGNGSAHFVEVPAVGAQTTLGNGLTYAVGTAVDAADDAFVATGSEALEFPPECTSTACAITVASGFSSSFGIALDGTGDVFITDLNNNNVVEVNRSQASTLAFSSTPVSTTSSPMTVGLQNIGNQPLTFASFAASTNFTVDSGSTTCSTSSPLAVGASCNIGVNCAPAAVGALSGTLTITDNALNVTGNTQSVPLSCTGLQDTTTTSLSANPNPSYGGQTVAFTATVSPAPTYASGLGTVTFKANGTAVGTIGLLTASNGVAVLNYSSLAPGTTYTMAATYNSPAGGSLAGSTSNTVSQLVNVEPTTTTLSASNATSVWGQPVTLTATVSTSNGETPTGTVAFKNGATNLGTGALAKSGTGQAQAVLTLSSLPVAANAITADYTGTKLIEASTSTPATTVAVTPATSTTAVTTSSSPSLYGSMITLTATVTPEYGGIPTQGTVTFYAGNEDIGVLNVNSSGKAALNISSLDPGTYAVAAKYNGSTNVDASAPSPAISQVISQIGTSTAVSAATTPPYSYGQSVPFTATVTPASGTTTPTGTVAFYYGNGACPTGCTELGTETLSDGQATLSAATLPAGSDKITAKYLGVGLFTASSGATSITVGGVPSTTALTAAPNPSTGGQTVTFTATVTSAGGVPTGTLTFKSGGTAIGTITLSAGVARLNDASLKAGTYSITAVYNGSAGIAGSTSNAVSQVVNLDTSSTSLADNGPIPSTTSQSVTLVATVTPGNGVAATGTVSFYSGAPTGTHTLLGNAALSGGKATLNHTFTKTGTYNLYATYTGSGYKSPSTSTTTVTQTVN